MPSHHGSADARIPRPLPDVLRDGGTHAILPPTGLENGKAIQSVTHFGRVDLSLWHRGWNCTTSTDAKPAKCTSQGDATQESTKHDTYGREPPHHQHFQELKPRVLTIADCLVLVILRSREVHPSFRLVCTVVSLCWRTINYKIMNQARCV